MYWRVTVGAHVGGARSTEGRRSFLVRLSSLSVPCRWRCYKLYFLTYLWMSVSGTIHLAGPWQSRRFVHIVGPNTQQAIDHRCTQAFAPNGHETGVWLASVSHAHLDLQRI